MVAGHARRPERPAAAREQEQPLSPARLCLLPGSSLGSLLGQGDNAECRRSRRGIRPYVRGLFSSEPYREDAVAMCAADGAKTDVDRSTDPLPLGVSPTL